MFNQQDLINLLACTDVAIEVQGAKVSPSELSVMAMLKQKLVDAIQVLNTTENTVEATETVSEATEPEVVDVEIVE